MRRGSTGTWRTVSMAGETVRAFVPAALPPEPPLDYSAARQQKLEQALRALGRLDAIAALLPEPDIFLYAYVRREAVLSSQIEGTQSSLQNLLAAEAQLFDPDTPRDVNEVANYVRATNHGLARFNELPVWVRLNPRNPCPTAAQRAWRPDAAGRAAQKPKLDRACRLQLERRDLRAPAARASAAGLDRSRTIPARRRGAAATRASGLATSSSRPFTRSSTATAASVGC